MRGETIVTLGIMAGLAVIIAAVAVLVSKQRDYQLTCPVVTVKKIGGCNSEGYCSVIYSDERVGRQHFPVEGVAYHICR